MTCDTIKSSKKSEFHNLPNLPRKKQFLKKRGGGGGGGGIELTAQIRYI